MRQILPTAPTASIMSGQMTCTVTAGHLNQQHSLASQQPSFGGNKLLLTPADVAPRQLSDSPPTADNGDRGPVRPIGVERYLFNQKADIWSTNKVNGESLFVH